MKQFLLSSLFLLTFFTGFSQIPEEGLVAYYPFLGNADDVTAFQNNGDVEGAVLTEDRFGTTDAAYYFNGVDDRIVVPDSDELSLNENFTISAWVLPEEIKTQMIFVKGTNVNGSNAAPYGLSFSETEDYIFSTRPNEQLVQARGGNYSAGDWILMTGVKEGQSMKLYVNGVFFAEEVAVGELVDNDSPLIIGTRLQLPSSTFSGKIDDIRIYNRALSPVEVGSIYNEGDDVYQISGNVSLDGGSNNCTSGNYSIPNAIIQATNNEGETFATTTQSDGSYNLILFSEGEMSVNILQESVPEYVGEDDDVVVFLDQANPSQVVDFCVEATQSISDVSISLIPLQLPRPGVAAQYIVQYENLGSQVMNGDIIFEFNDDIMFYVTAELTPSTINASSIVWSYDELIPFESRTFSVTFELFIPPVVEGGEELLSSIQITPLDGDFDIDNNRLDIEEVVVNSFDPNDKQVLQGDEIFEEQIGTFLDYIVRFQNTGTADALKVVVTDTLSDNLDWKTFRILDSSHDYRVEITNDNEVAFIFEDINLPPQEQDEEGSNGYIAFEVRTNDNLEIGDAIENTANIFFDFNEPIITNTVVTTVAEPLGLEQFETTTISVYPNPVSDMLFINLPAGAQFINVTLLSVQGQMVRKSTLPEVELSSLPSGIYFLKIKTTTGEVTKKVVKK